MRVGSSLRKCPRASLAGYVRGWNFKVAPFCEFTLLKASKKRPKTVGCGEQDGRVGAGPFFVRMSRGKQLVLLYLVALEELRQSEKTTMLF